MLPRALYVYVLAANFSGNDLTDICWPSLCGKRGLEMYNQMRDVGGNESNSFCAQYPKACCHTALKRVEIACVLVAMFAAHGPQHLVTY